MGDVKPASVYSSYGPSQSGSVEVLGRPHLGEGHLYRWEGQEVADAPTQGDPLMSSFEFRERKVGQDQKLGRQPARTGWAGWCCGKGVTVLQPPQLASLRSHRVHDLVFLCSDGTLNPNGVRFGSSEIYNIGEHFPFSWNNSQVIQEGRKEGPSREPALQRSHLLA